MRCTTGSPSHSRTVPAGKSISTPTSPTCSSTAPPTPRARVRREVEQRLEPRRAARPTTSYRPRGHDAVLACRASRTSRRGSARGTRARRRRSRRARASPVGCSIVHRRAAIVATVPGTSSSPPATPSPLHLGEERRLVREDVRGIVVEVVEREQVVVEEARRARDREPHRRADVGEVVDGPLHLVGPLADRRARASRRAGSRRPSGTRSRRRTG